MRPTARPAGRPRAPDTGQGRDRPAPNTTCGLPRFTVAYVGDDVRGLWQRNYQGLSGRFLAEGNGSDCGEVETEEESCFWFLVRQEHEPSASEGKYSGRLIEIPGAKRNHRVVGVQHVGELARCGAGELHSGAC